MRDPDLGCENSSGVPDETGSRLYMAVARGIVMNDGRPIRLASARFAQVREPA